jgi:hypothetical protein
VANFQKAKAMGYLEINAKAHKSQMKYGDTIYFQPAHNPMTVNLLGATSQLKTTNSY